MCSCRCGSVGTVTEIPTIEHRTHEKKILLSSFSSFFVWISLESS